MCQLSSCMKINMLVMVLMVSFFAMCVCSVNGQELEPDKGINITLDVYSGLPNPQWWLTTGADYERVIHLIKTLEVDEEILFNYDEWNRLGYASFRITSKKVEGLPYSIHVWRDMAYVVHDKEGKVGYATGATQIYDLLVAQAEKKGQEKFFLNYHRYKEEKKSE